MNTIRSTGLLAAIGLVAFSTAAFAQEGEAPAITPKVLVKNLENPSGIAIHGKTGHVFVASRYGVYRYLPAEQDKSKKIFIEIDEYPTDVYGKGPTYNIGPLGLAFMDETHLIVGDGSRKDGEELVRVYKIEDTPPSEYRKEDSAEFTLGPIPKSDQTTTGEGNFYGVAVGAGAIFVSCNGDDTKGWISKAPITDGKPGTLAPAIATKEKTMVDAPVPVIFNKEGELVVGQMGEVNVAGDSLLTTYDPASGELKKQYTTGLSDIAGLAYHPKNNKLYAVDFAWADTSQGGLFELVIEGDAVKATKVVGLDKPAALAFDAEGNLYLAVFGTAPEGDMTNLPGTLQRIEAAALGG